MFTVAFQTQFGQYFLINPEEERYCYSIGLANATDNYSDRYLFDTETQALRCAKAWWRGLDYGTWLCDAEGVPIREFDNMAGYSRMTEEGM